MLERMGDEFIQPSRSRTHIPIFSYERKGGSFTGDIVCTVCGVYLSEHDPLTRQEQAVVSAGVRPSLP
jgi:hypothetical protein